MSKVQSCNYISLAGSIRRQERNNNKAVITTDHTNRGIRSNVIPVDHILITVVITFTSPRIEDTPSK